MNRTLLAGIAAGTLIVGAAVAVTKPLAPSLPDVEVPAIELSNAGQDDATAAWLGLFTQASGSSPVLGTGLLESGQLGLPEHTSVIVIDPQDPDPDYAGILDSVGTISNPLEAVTSAINGPDAVTFLNPGSNPGSGANGS